MTVDISRGNAPDAREDDARDDEDNDSEESSYEDASCHVSQMAVSADGQWLATSDLHGRTHVFNLDVVKVNYFIR
jgi:U3 small nucleolar RNA-associated protein 4